MEFVLAYAICLIATGIVASNKNRSWAGWIVLSVIISPILSLIIVACLPKINK